MALARRMATGLVHALDADHSPWASLHLCRDAAFDRSGRSISPDRPDPLAPPGQEGATLRLMSLHGAMALRADDLRDFLTLLSGIQLPDGQAGLDAAAHGLWQLACARLPSGIARALGEPVVAVDAAPSVVRADAAEATDTIDTTEIAVRLTLRTDDGERHSFPLSMSAATLRRWTDAAGWSAARTSTPTGRIAALALPAAWWLGRVSLPAARVASLRPGDALWLPIVSASSEQLLAVGSHLLKTIGAQDASCVFAGWGSPGGADSNPFHAFAVPSAPLMDTLTVDLDFIAGRLSLTVRDLCDLQVGSVLPLETLMPAQVRIVAHGTQLGAGELVDVDGRLAVEIVEWEAAR